MINYENNGELLKEYVKYLKNHPKKYKLWQLVYEKYFILHHWKSQLTEDHKRYGYNITVHCYCEHCCIKFPRIFLYMFNIWSFNQVRYLLVDHLGKDLTFFIEKEYIRPPDQKMPLDISLLMQTYAEYLNCNPNTKKTDKCIIL